MPVRELDCTTAPVGKLCVRYGVECPVVAIPGWGDLVVKATGYGPNLLVGFVASYDRAVRTEPDNVVEFYVVAGRRGDMVNSGGREWLPVLF